MPHPFLSQTMTEPANSADDKDKVMKPFKLLSVCVKKHFQGSKNAQTVFVNIHHKPIVTSGSHYIQLKASPLSPKYFFANAFKSFQRKDN